MCKIIKKKIFFFKGKQINFRLRYEFSRKITMSNEELIQKYLNGDLDKGGCDELKRLLGEKELKRLNKEKYLIDLWIFNSKQDKTARLDEAKVMFKENNTKIIHLTWFKYAAVAVVILAVLIIEYNSGIFFNQPKFADNSIILKLQDGSERIISKENGVILLEDIAAEIDTGKTLLSYTDTDNKDKASNKIEYNELIVPKGKRFKVKLSDGTLVYLNSKSHLKYPIYFGNMPTREVVLEGEGYFQVAKNPDQPFIVNTNSVSVTVLGTHFNVRCYDEDNEVKTTLEEGKVLTKLLGNQQEVYLKPGEAAVLSKEDNYLIKENVDVENDIAWVFNRLFFNNEPFNSIIKKIERSYGVSLVCKDDELLNKCFYGDFDIETETVNDVLDAFAITGYFKYSQNKRGEIKIIVNN